MQKRDERVRSGLLIIMLALLTACSGATPGARIPAQEWQDIVFEVQTQPEPVQPGMNEFLVLATEKRGRPVHDLIISMRTSSEQPWRQSIQDGFSGVYRRALGISASDAELVLQIKRKGDDAATELHFPLRATNTLVQ
jgi:hypothetical protein